MNYKRQVYKRMTKDEVMIYLKEYGNEQTKKIYISHGAKEPLYGVKLGDLKALKKKIKTDHNLALELYKTGNTDAMYFAGLIEDPKEVTIEQLNEWVKAAYWDMLSERCVAVVVAKTPFGFEIARKWIKSSEEEIVCADYAVYSTLFLYFINIHWLNLCLTDLKQSLILNCFDLIYMIKIRTNIMGTIEFIEIEKQLQPDRELKQDESLEKAVFRVEDVEQISLL